MRRRGVAAVLLLGALAACSDDPDPGSATEPSPVSTVRSVRRPVTRSSPSTSTGRCRKCRWIRRLAVSSSGSLSVQSVRVLTTCLVWFDEWIAAIEPSSKSKSSG